MPSSNPTTGLGVAAYLTLTGTNLTNPSGGTLAHPGSNGANGQGIGATAGGVFPVAQYALTLSLSASGGYAATCQLAVESVDVQDNSQANVTGSALYKSYNNPSAGSPAWFRPSVFAGYATDVASVSSGGLITAIAVGHAIIEAQYPTFANTEGDEGGSFNDPIDMIYVQVAVTVIP